MWPRSGLLLALCPCLCYRGREGGMRREKSAFYCFPIYWQIANLPPSSPSLTLTSSPSSSSSLTKQHLLWTACSVLSPKNYPHSPFSPAVGKVTACCSAHPPKPIINSSIRLPPPHGEHTEECTNTQATSWQQKHMQSRPHSPLSPPVSYTNRQNAEICSFLA